VAAAQCNPGDPHTSATSREDRLAWAKYPWADLWAGDLVFV